MIRKGGCYHLQRISTLGQMRVAVSRKVLLSFVRDRGESAKDYGYSVTFSSSGMSERASTRYSYQVLLRNGRELLVQQLDYSTLILC